jgi:hypothetical protein
MVRFIPIVSQSFLVRNGARNLNGASCPDTDAFMPVSLKDGEMVVSQAWNGVLHEAFAVFFITSHHKNWCAWINGRRMSMNEDLSISLFPRMADNESEAMPIFLHALPDPIIHPILLMRDKLRF